MDKLNLLVIKAPEVYFEIDLKQVDDVKQAGDFMEESGDIMEQASDIMEQMDIAVSQLISN